jgi:hypothetical protein
MKHSYWGWVVRVENVQARRGLGLDKDSGRDQVHVSKNGAKSGLKMGWNWRSWRTMADCSVPSGAPTIRLYAVVQTQAPYDLLGWVRCRAEQCSLESGIEAVI